MNLLLIDFESTGVDTAKDRITEIGAMVVDENFQPSPQSKALISQLVYDETYPELTAEITKITGISKEMLLSDGVDPMTAWQRLADMPLHDIGYIVAYNRAFDENLFKAEVERVGAGMIPMINRLLQPPWLCAMNDIETSADFKSKRLMHAALEYGVTVNPKELHRAINDVELMRQLLIESKATPQAMWDYQNEPTEYLRAMVAKPWEDNGKSTDEAKKLGYSFQVARGDETGRVFDKCWVKRVKRKYRQKEMESSPFQVRVIGDL